MNRGMPRSSHRLARGAALLLVIASTAASARAEDALEQAKRSYAEAAYEESLRALGSLDSLEAQQYKALCFLALGRTQDASGAVDALVGAAPLFAPSEELPPRFMALVVDAKRRLLPAAARRAFAKGREYFNAKSHQEALKEFDYVLSLTADPLITNSTESQDLRTLAAGFVDLARANTAPSVQAPAKATPPAPAATRVALREVVQATAIRQDIPALPADLTRFGASMAVVRVTIGADGHVTAAALDRSVHPRYNELLLKAAYGWIYKPATLDGRPVASEKSIAVRLP
jgi:tetratricopeptide (TPR) repeat protein